MSFGQNMSIVKFHPVLANMLLKIIRSFHTAAHLWQSKQETHETVFHIVMVRIQAYHLGSHSLWTFIVLSGRLGSLAN